MFKKSYSIICVWTLLFFATCELRGQSGASMTPLEQAQFFYNAKNYDSSLVVLKRYAPEAKASEDWAGLFSAQSLMSQNYNRQKNYTARLTAADAALNTASQHLMEQDSTYALALKAKGDAFIRTQAYDSSIYYLKKAEALYLQNAKWNRVTTCRVGIGSNLYRLGQFHTADSILTSTRQLIEQKINPLPSIYGTVLNLLSAIYNTTGDYEKGLENATKAVRFRENLSTQGQRLIFAYNNLGMTYFNRADYDKAQEILERAEITAQPDVKANASALVTIYNNLMLTHLRKKGYTTALDYAFKKLALIDENSISPRKSDQIIFFNNLALIYLETAAWDKAKSYLDQALALKPDAYQTLSNLGYYYYRQREAGLATDFLQRAIAVFDRPESPEIAKLYRYLAKMASIQKEHKLAMQYFQKSISVLASEFEDASEASNPELTGIRSKRELLKVLSDKAEHLLSNEIDQSLANETLITAIALVDSMYYDHKAEGSRVFLKSEALPLYELAIEAFFKIPDVKNDSDRLSYLFTLFEKGKSSQLSDLIQVKNANLMAGLPRTLIEREQRLLIDIAFYESELYKSRSAKNEDKARLYDRYRLEKINELDQLIEEFKNSYPKYYRARHKPKRLNLQEVQKELKERDELLIEYFIGARSVYAMAISADNVVLKRLEDRSVVSVLAEQFINSVNQPALLQKNSLLAFEQLTTQGYVLYQQLLAPLLDAFEKQPSAIHIVPDGFLSFLPFEALITQPVSGKPDFIKLPYLIKDQPVRYSYSASLPSTNSPKVWGSPSVLAMAPFGRQDLPNSEEEINKADVHYTTTLLHGSEGMESSFQKLANGHNILHLATHGTINAQAPEQSYLRFADSAADSTDGRLHVYELESMNLDAQLAILSACETGTGNFVTGEGVMSLARGFTYAGVPSVLMSLWKVDDRSGTDLISNFYEGLSQESNKAVALQQAKLRYLENADQLHAHPYFWSQFVLVGDATPLRSVSTLPLWFTGIALLLLAVLVVIRRRLSKGEN